MATATATRSSSRTRTAEYKGRKYRLLWIGHTKFGYRAHLEFFDGTKEFWCDGSMVMELESGRSSVTWKDRERAGDRYLGTRYEGHYCGYPCPVTGRKCCPANGPCHDCE